MTTSWTTRVERDENGDVYVLLPEEAVAALGWRPGDVLSCEIREDGAVVLRRADEADETMA